MMKRSRLVIKGKVDYINYLASHLKKEHPSTRKRMRIVTKKKSKRKDKECD